MINEKTGSIYSHTEIRTKRKEEIIPSIDAQIPYEGKYGKGFTRFLPHPYDDERYFIEFWLTPQSHISNAFSKDVYKSAKEVILLHKILWSRIYEDVEEHIYLRSVKEHKKIIIKTLDKIFSVHHMSYCYLCGLFKKCKECPLKSCDSDSLYIKICTEYGFCKCELSSYGSDGIYKREQKYLLQLISQMINVVDKINKEE